MKRRLLLTLLTALALAGCASVQHHSPALPSPMPDEAIILPADPPQDLPQDPTVEGLVYALVEGEATLLGYSDDLPADLVIPSAIDGYPVVAIGKRAFAGAAIRTLTVGEGLKRIEEEAFGDCASLQQAVLPTTLERIGAGAMRGCGALADLTIPFVGERPAIHAGTWQYPLGYLFGSEPYAGGAMITQYYHGETTDEAESADYCLPASLRRLTLTGTDTLDTHLPYEGLGRCDMLTDITLGKGIASIGEYALLGCTATVRWQDSPLTEIGEHALSGYLGRELALPQGVTEIKTGGLDDCYELRSITLNDELQTIGPYAFAHCTALAAVTWGRGLTRIGVCAFDFCTALSDLALPEGLQVIEEGAFARCKSLKIVSIPASVRTIFPYAFEGCALKKAAFARANGWRLYNRTTSDLTVDGQNLADESKAAYYLKEYYCDYYWGNERGQNP